MHHLFALKNFSCALALCLALAAVASAQQVELLDFTSDSCPACVQMEPVLRDLAAAGAPVRRVDVNREAELTARFGVEYLPTFIAVADGREIDRHVGATSPDHLRQMLQRAHAAAAPAQQAAVAQQQQQQLSRGQSPDHAQPRSRTVPAHTVSASLPPAETVSDGDLVASSVRLRVEDPRGISYGTGTVISASTDEAIVLTCGHLFRESQGKLPVQVELFAPDAEAPRVEGVIEGEVIGYDLVRDLGFVRFRPDRPVQARPVAARGISLATGEKVASVGCDHGKQPSVWRTRVTAIDRYVGPANIEAAGTPVQGRSGGGLFSERGELVGVCFAADEEGNEGLYVGIPAIYEELDRLDLARASQDTRLATRPQPAAPPAAQAFDSADRSPRGALTVSAPLTSSLSPSLAGQSGTRMVPVGQREAAPAEPQQPQPQSFTAEEQAALAEIAQRSGGGEVIVIIRPKSAGDRCEIFSLENPSSEFLQQLTALGSRATHPRFTTHKEVPVRQVSVPVAGRLPSERPAAAGPRGIEGWSAVE